MLWVLPLRWGGTEAPFCELRMTLKLAEATSVLQGYILCGQGWDAHASWRQTAGSLGSHLVRVRKRLSLGTLQLEAWGLVKA